MNVRRNFTCLLLSLLIREVSMNWCFPPKSLIPLGILLTFLIAPSSVLAWNAPEELEQLILQLGDNTFEVREQATEQLEKIGLPARAALLEGLNHKDSEVRRRCQKILVSVLQADYQQRLQQFRTNGTGGFGLDGWERFQQIAGNGPAARQLFVDMHEQESGLMASAEIGGQEAAQALKLRLAQAYRLMQVSVNGQRRDPSVGTICSLLFLLGDPEIKLPVELVQSGYWYSLVQRQGFTNEAKQGKLKTPVRRLLSVWIRVSEPQNLAYQKLRIAMNLNLEAGLPLAMDLLKKRGQSPVYRAYALETVARVGGKPYAKILADSLDDTAMVSRYRNRTIQVNDIALAWLVYLTDQKIDDYSQPEAKKWFELLNKYPNQSFNYRNFGYEEADKRKEALEKWKSWVQHNPLQELPTELPQTLNRDEVSADLPMSKTPQKQAEAVAKPQVQLGIAKAAARLNQQLANRKQAFVAAQQRQQQQEEDEDNEEEPLLIESMLNVDRLETQKLLQAKRLLKENIYSDAVRLLDSILENEVDYFYRADLDVSLYRPLKPEAERLLGQLPEAGRAAYELQFGLTARKLLDEGLENRDWALIERVATRFFHTAAGSEATYRVAIRHRDFGRALPAAFYFHRLQTKSFFAKQYEPGLSLQLAACWLRAERPESARKVLQKLQAEVPGQQVRIAGGPKPLFQNPANALTWLESYIGPQPRPALAEGWAMHRGSAKRNTIQMAESPYLKPMYSKQTLTNGTVRKSVEKYRQAYQQERRALVPTIHPLVVNDVICYRTATGIEALNWDNGQVRWRASWDDPLSYLLDHSSTKQQQDQESWLVSGLRSRLADNLTFGTLSSNGSAVFAIEQSPFVFGPDYQRIRVTANGRRALDTSQLGQSHLLTAYDLNSGKILWELGDLQTEQSLRFLGAPLPLGGQLYVVAKVDLETRLLVLDGATGKVQWQLLLEYQEFNPNVNRRVGFNPYYAVQTEPEVGVSPSYSDGVLICPTSAEAFVAIDLTTRSIVWKYQAESTENQYTKQQRARLGPQVVENQQGWEDSTVAIAGDYAVLTPRKADRLFCLNMETGELAWSASRRDGLYVAGVADEKVIVVGRSKVWALQLADGAPAWPDRETHFSGASMPSGQGYLSPEALFLPLDSGEVIVIGLASGNVLGRPDAPDNLVPGNLVYHDQAILSLGLQGLARFETLPTRQMVLAASLQNRPDDAKLITDLGETLLYSGEIEKALEQLKLAVELDGSEEARRLLGEAIVAGLDADFVRYEPEVTELLAMLPKPTDRLPVWKHLAKGYQQQKQTQPAFESYMEWIDLLPEKEETIALTIAREVLPSRMIQSGLWSLYQQCSPEDRKWIDTQIQENWLEPSKHAAAIRFFAWHPFAEQARLAQAKDLLERNQFLAAEQLLLQVAQHGTVEEQLAAFAGLADLYRKAKRPDEAAPIYRYLARTFPTHVCWNGKTGSELVAALPANDPVRQEIAQESVWPVGAVSQSTSKSGSRTSNRECPVAVFPTLNPIARGMSARIDYRGRFVVGVVDGGRRQWKIDFGESATKYYYSRSIQNSQAVLSGNVFALWTGLRLAMIDTLSPKPKMLWDRGFSMNDLPVQQRNRFAVALNGLAGNNALGKVAYRGVMVGREQICFQQYEKLVACDLLTGKTIWSRDDLSYGCDLFGDDQYLFVTPKGAQETQILSMINGEELGRVRLPAVADRLTTVGRNMLTYIANDTEGRLKLSDAWTGQTLWEQTLPPGKKLSLASPSEIVAFDAAGDLQIFDVSSGKQILQASLPAVPEMESFEVVPNGKRLLLLANQPVKQANLRVNRNGAYGMFFVNGQVIAVDRESGTQLWRQEILNQLLFASYAGNAPVMIFGNTVQEVKKLPNGGMSYNYKGYQLQILDTRTGKILYEDLSRGYSTPSEIRFDIAKKTIEVVLRNQSVKLVFTGQPAESKEQGQKSVEQKQDDAKKSPSANVPKP